MTRRHFLRLPLAALFTMLPTAAVAQIYPYEPDTEAITMDSLNKEILFLKNEWIYKAITDQWQTFNIKAMLKCFRGCGMIPKQRYRA